ncbi:MAG: VCBS repeat-containing protein, partial [Myxococcota bacterium]
MISLSVTLLATPGLASPFGPLGYGTHLEGTDFDGDGLDDLAFHRPGSTWNTVPVAFSDGGGTWTPTNHPVPRANDVVIQAIAGDFDGDGRTDFAMRQERHGWWFGGFSEFPVALSNGNGSFHYVAPTAPSGLVHDVDAEPVVGDYDGDGLDDIAFHYRWSPFPRTTLLVLYSNGDGTWRDVTHAVPSWANQYDVRAHAIDHDGDGLTDLVFQRPGGGWSSIPVLQ